MRKRYEDEEFEDVVKNEKGYSIGGAKGGRVWTGMDGGDLR
jgi:hypothetical protein